MNCGRTYDDALDSSALDSSIMRIIWYSYYSAAVSYHHVHSHFMAVLVELYSSSGRVKKLSKGETTVVALHSFVILFCVGPARLN